MSILWNAGHETTTDYSSKEFTKSAKPTYAGAVIAVHGREERIMSDVWAWVTYASVWTGSAVADVAISCSDPHSVYGTATVDATPAVLEAVAAFRAAAAVVAEAAAKAALVNRKVAEAKRVAKGKTVTVVKGRKVAKGTTGEIFWLGETKFGTRVGIKDAAGTVHWTAITNVEVTNPDEHLDLDGLLAA